MDADTLFRFALALAFVLALIALVAWIARRLRLGGPLMTARRPSRLGVVEVLTLDARRRLVLLKRDDREHLVLLGPSGDIVVERGRPAPRFDLSQPAPAPSGPPRPAPQAVGATTPGSEG